MRYLLDTHVLLWMREEDRRLPKEKWDPIFFGGEHASSALSFLRVIGELLPFNLSSQHLGNLDQASYR